MAVTVDDAVGGVWSRVVLLPVPAVLLPAVSRVRTDSVLAPAARVTPLADQVLPEGVAVTQVVPPSALTWIDSPAPRVPVNVPLTVCEAVLVDRKSVVQGEWVAIGGSGGIEVESVWSRGQ